MTEILKIAWEAAVYMIIDLINQNLEGVIAAEWELNTNVNCFKGRRNTVEKGKTIVSVIEKLLTL